MEINTGVEEAMQGVGISGRVGEGGNRDSEAQAEIRLKNGNTGETGLGGLLRLTLVLNREKLVAVRSKRI